MNLKCLPSSMLVAVDKVETLWSIDFEQHGSKIILAISDMVYLTKFLLTVRCGYNAISRQSTKIFCQKSFRQNLDLILRPYACKFELNLGKTITKCTLGHVRSLMILTNCIIISIYKAV